MSKKNSLSVTEQATAESSASTEIQNSTEQKPKSLADLKKQFDRLDSLFNKKARFELALDQLAKFDSELKSEDASSFESGRFSLELANSYTRQEIKISNRIVLSETIGYLKSRIAAKIGTIEEEILKG